MLQLVPLYDGAMTWPMASTRAELVGGRGECGDTVRGCAVRYPVERAVPSAARAAGVVLVIVNRRLCLWEKAYLVMTYVTL